MGGCGLWSELTCQGHGTESTLWIGWRRSRPPSSCLRFHWASVANRRPPTHLLLLVLGGMMGMGMRMRPQSRRHCPCSEKEPIREIFEAFVLTCQDSQRSFVVACLAEWIIQMRSWQQGLKWTVGSSYVVDRARPHLRFQLARKPLRISSSRHFRFWNMSNDFLISKKSNWNPSPLFEI